MPLITMHASAARTATGNAAQTKNFEKYTKLRTELRVTAASGTTPTLDVKLQDTMDGTNYNDITGGAFAQKTTTGAEVINVTSLFANQLRVLYTIGGTTPSFTFTVIAHARP